MTIEEWYARAIAIRGQDLELVEDLRQMACSLRDTYGTEEAMIAWHEKMAAARVYQMDGMS